MKFILRTKTLNHYVLQSKNMIVLNQCHQQLVQKTISYLNVDVLLHCYTVKVKSTRSQLIYQRKMIYIKMLWKLLLNLKIPLLLKIYFVISCICKIKNYLLLCYILAMNLLNLMLHLKLHGDVVFKSMLCHTLSNLLRT